MYAPFKIFKNTANWRNYNDKKENSGIDDFYAAETKVDTEMREAHKKST
jgi:hypothetical protein